MSLRHRLSALAALVAVASPLLMASVPADAAPTTTARKPPVVTKKVVGSNPADVAIAQNLGRAYVVTDGGIDVVSLLTGRNLATVSLNGWHGQNAIALARGNTQGYVTNVLKDTVVVFDTENYKVIRTIKVGTGASDVVKANTPAGQRIYVVTQRSTDPSDTSVNALIAIDPATGKIVKRTKLPDWSQSIAVGPGPKTIWVADGDDDPGRIWQVSTATGKIVKTTKVPGPAMGMAFAPGKKKLWTAGPDGVAVTDVRTGKTTKLIKTPKIFTGYSQPTGIALSGSGRYAFVANEVSNERGSHPSVAAIDTKTYKVVWRLKVDSTPAAIAVDTTRDRAYVPSYDLDTLSTFSVPN